MIDVPVAAKPIDNPPPGRLRRRRTACSTPIYRLADTDALRVVIRRIPG